MNKNLILTLVAIVMITASGHSGPESLNDVNDALDGLGREVYTLKERVASLEGTIQSLSRELDLIRAGSGNP